MNNEMKENEGTQRRSRSSGGGFSYEIKSSSVGFMTRAARTLMLQEEWYSKKSSKLVQVLVVMLKLGSKVSLKKQLMADNGSSLKLGDYWDNNSMKSEFVESKTVSSRTSLMYVIGQFFDPTKYKVRPANLCKGWALNRIALSGNPKKYFVLLYFLRESNYNNCIPSLATYNAPVYSPMRSPFWYSLVAKAPLSASAWTMLLQGDAFFPNSVN